MNQLQVFNNKELGQVRTIVKNEDVWFVAKDVCEVLEIKNTTVAMQKLDKDEVTKFNLGGLSGDTNIINESGLYTLIMTSRKPQAKSFRKWVTSEVLPAIRKDGGYIHTTQDDTDEDILARAVLVAQKAIEKKDKMIEQQRQMLLQQEPMVTFAEACMQSDKSLKVSEVAKMAAKHNIKIGQRQLFAKIREWGLMFKRSTEPTQKAVEQGLFEITQGVKQKPSGEPFTWTTTYVTPKGQAYIIDRLKKEVS